MKRDREKEIRLQLEVCRRMGEKEE